MTEAKPQLHLKVVTPSRVAVDVVCDQVTLPGALGAPGILPGHTPLLTQLRIGELWYTQGMREHYLALQWGFGEVASDEKSTRVTVLAEVAELPEKVAAEAALKSATGEEFDHQRAHLEAAVTRSTVASRQYRPSSPGPPPSATEGSPACRIRSVAGRQDREKPAPARSGRSGSYLDRVDRTPAGADQLERGRWRASRCRPWVVHSWAPAE
jgi:F-type H+-transporting ATPase subunit epsilon